MLRPISPQTPTTSRAPLRPSAAITACSPATYPRGNDAELHLSRFDGIHALRLDGHFVSPDRIEGVFHVAPGRPLNFVATRSVHLRRASRKPSASPRSRIPPSLSAFTARMPPAPPSRKTIQRFRGKVVLLDIFGTWCPNCHDEAPVLQWLYAKFHARGLEIVGLSYEYVDDRARSQRLLGIYRRKYSIALSVAAGWHHRTPARSRRLCRNCAISAPIPPLFFLTGTGACVSSTPDFPVLPPAGWKK